ncbi:MAG: hypothetical protein FJZ00_01890 [Candidatus Sericytochromatia bacterium]|uniref:Uncharacterized protein n=1 Tax=Candidatus Tanganyikabacteria bacterium TaxID=2961651 RepID=A0A938BK57_9BACT|nr:hypothetical protein [Candidatus Tanganyikabacteria bacterium]
MYNQFLSTMGPRPANAQPLPIDPNQFAYDFNAGQHAQEEALQMGLRDMIDAQVAGTRTQSQELAAQGVGMAAKKFFPGFGQAVRGAADYAMAPVKAAMAPVKAGVKAGVDAVQSYIQGGATTTGSTAAAAAPSFFDTLSSSFGSVLPYAGAAKAAYDMYTGTQDSLNRSRDMRNALDQATWMTRGQRADVHDDAIEAALKQGDVNAAKGAAAGWAVGGPFGAAVGGALGQLSGQVGAFGAARGSPGGDWKNLADAQVQHQGFDWGNVRKHDGLARALALSKELHVAPFKRLRRMF